VNVLERLGRPPAVAALAGEEDVYVVGGAVRDLLLAREPRELDFVVEGDAVAVARRAARRLNGRVVVHDRFGTATVEAPGAVFDLAGARRERYERPGALPTVELGAPLHDDLARRDFTVNALALHLVDGRLIAWPGAEEDLRAGRLRVLHERSFLDDPTRLLRLARYAARLGFDPDPGTDALAAGAVAAVDTVTGARIGAELRLLLAEPQPAALERLERHGLGAAILGDFAVDAGIVAVANDLDPSGLAALATTLQGADRVAATLDRLGFEARERDVVSAAVARAPRLAEAMAAADGDAALWRALRREPAEVVAAAGALGPADRARRWLDDLRHRRLAITGHDIVAAGLGGPAVGRALERAMEAHLDGRAPGREEQLHAALGS
jgi:tRNA nucleotidyltransferase (CCA-adding enzyme)